jgi:hypothetical protein
MNQRAQDPLMGAPAAVEDARLRELNLALIAPPAEEGEEDDDNDEAGASA